jgi:hypothetical protein
MIEVVELRLVPPPPVVDDLVAQTILHDGDLPYAGEPRLRSKALVEAGDLPR